MYSTNQKRALTNAEKHCEGLLICVNLLLIVLMFRSGYAALRGELLQERQGEQGRIGRLHKSDQEEHKPERRGRCYHGRLKGLSVLFH